MSFVCLFFIIKFGIFKLVYMNRESESGASALEGYKGLGMSQEEVDLELEFGQNPSSKYANGQWSLVKF